MPIQHSAEKNIPKKSVLIAIQIKEQMYAYIAVTQNRIIDVLTKVATAGAKITQKDIGTIERLKKMSYEKLKGIDEAVKSFIEDRTALDVMLDGLLAKIPKVESKSEPVSGSDSGEESELGSNVLEECIQLFFRVLADFNIIKQQLLVKAKYDANAEGHKDLDASLYGVYEKWVNQVDQIKQEVEAQIKNVGLGQGEPNDVAMFINGKASVIQQLGFLLKDFQKQISGYQVRIASQQNIMEKTRKQTIKPLLEEKGALQAEISQLKKTINHTLRTVVGAKLSGLNLEKATKLLEEERLSFEQLAEPLNKLQRIRAVEFAPLKSKHALLKKEIEQAATWLERFSVNKIKWCDIDKLKFKSHLKEIRNTRQFCIGYLKVLQSLLQERVELKESKQLATDLQVQIEYLRGSIKPVEAKLAKTAQKYQSQHERLLRQNINLREELDKIKTEVKKNTTHETKLRQAAEESCRRLSEALAQRISRVDNKSRLTSYAPTTAVNTDSYLQQPGASTKEDTCLLSHRR